MELSTKRSTSTPKLVLEPVRSSMRVDSHPLALGRYLIGSAADCDITITVAGVAPQHCLMIVGANKTVVKAISPLTWINDGPLTEAVLKHGERLILGPVELRTRLPEVSEWVSQGDDSDAKTKAPAPSIPSVTSQYEPPQIEELLDQARQHLQTAIDGTMDQADSWSEDLPLTEAVKIHAASAVVSHQPDMIVAAPDPGSSVTEIPGQAARIELLKADLDRRAMELDERARAVDYLATELSTREEQLLTRERELIGRESRLQSVVNEVDQREESLIAEERALHARLQQAEEAERQSAQSISLQMEERARSLEEEQARVHQLFAVIEQQMPELQRQSAELAAQKQTLDAREAELTALESHLNQQTQEIHALAALPAAAAVDTSAIELREAALARREAVLATSMASLQTSRTQIAEESSQLEQRFADLVVREQAWQQRVDELSEIAQRTEADAQSMSARLADLDQREQFVQTTSTELAEREAVLLKTKADVEAREQVLIALRVELDSREESLNQQFVQLQKDRSETRASQLKQQMSEQSGKKHLSELEQQLQKRASELDAEAIRVSQLLESHIQQLGLTQTQALEAEQQLEVARAELSSLQERFAELEQNQQLTTEQLVQSERELAEQRALLLDAQNSLEEMKSEFALAASRSAMATETQTGPSPEIEQQWAQLAQAQAEFVQDQQELSRWREELAALQALLELDRKLQEAAREERALHAKVDDSAPLAEGDDAQFGSHLHALLDERRTLSELRAEVESEYQALRSEREEVQQTRVRFEQEQAQLDIIKAEATTERDTFLLERQNVISMRQAFDERERQIRQREATSEQQKAEAEKTVAGLELQRRRLEEQRGHLEEEWESLREEREVQRQAEAELESQRQALTSFAQQLEQYKASGEPVALELSVIDVDDQYPEDTAVPDNTMSDVVAADNEELSAEEHDEADSEYEEEVIDPLAGFASFSSIGASSDEMLPPEIAEIIRRVGGQSSAAASQPSNLSPAGASPKPSAAEQPPLASAFLHAQEIPSQEEEDRRLHDLPGQSSESHVDAASIHADAATSDYETMTGEVGDQLEVNSENQSDDDAYALSSEVIAEPDHTGDAEAETPKSIELRSRLSEMFGIDLGPLRGAVSRSGEDQSVAAASGESACEVEGSDSSEAKYKDEAYQDSLEAGAQDSQQAEAAAEFEDEPVADEEEAPINESLDPVAAYMEQLLARTRKASLKAAPPAPKPVPPPIAPVTPSVPAMRVEEPRVSSSDLTEEEVPKATKSSRKLEQVDKTALRANLDSFRSIANTQARSNVARSESKRLILMSQAKQVFLVSSAVITIVLLSTEFWTDRKYRLEMLAGVIATTFLGFDYYRTQRRLRQLGLLSGGDFESQEDDKKQSNE